MYMANITICSDMGSNSYSLAALKGNLLRETGNAVHITDISNTIKPFDIVEAAFILSNSFHHFPAGTIHLLLVNPFYQEKHELIVMKRDGFYFIAPNNGLLSLLFADQTYDEAIRVTAIDNTLQLYEQIGSIVHQILQGGPLSEIGSAALEIHPKISLRPVISKDTIRGSVIFIDTYGNLVTNIHRTQFEKIRNDRSFAIYFRHKDPITKICSHYYEVSVGEELCLFNMGGYLKIAINMGSAQELLGLDLEDTIQIDFNQT